MEQSAGLLLGEQGTPRRGAVIAAATAVVKLINSVIGGLLSAIQGTIGSINGVLTRFQSL